MQPVIKADRLSFSYSDKDLFTNISFSVLPGEHCVLTGVNGTGKSTLLDIIVSPDNYLYTGKLYIDPDFRAGYVNQFVRHDKDTELTVFEYLGSEYESMQSECERLSALLESAEDFDAACELYQQSLDAFDAVDGYNYEVNIHKQLYTAGLTAIENVPVAGISGGEFKLIQIIRRMLFFPQFLVLDEPDAFLDFDNLTGLRNLINSYSGTILAVTHNRYLLNHCFNKVMHLENASLSVFEGSYSAYIFSLLQMKVLTGKEAEKEDDWIRIQEALVERLRKKATEVISADYGRTLRARVSYLERLNASRTRIPYVEDRIPSISFPELTDEELTSEEPLLKVTGYSLAFDKQLLSDVNFEILPGEKIALVGPNGAGKSSLLRDIVSGNYPGISFSSSARPALLSQLFGGIGDESLPVSMNFDKYSMNLADIRHHLTDYCFSDDVVYRKISTLSGGEKNLLQLAEIALGDANILLLDEPTSHLDIYTQLAFEEAVNSYKGAVLMVSHDFYTIANCADYVLLCDNGTIRRMSGRAFRKMIYKKHFSRDYLELEQSKKELELKINSLLRSGDYELAEPVCAELEGIVDRMQKAVKKA